MLIENMSYWVGNNRLHYSIASGISVMVASDPFDPQVTWRWYKVTWVDAVRTMGFCWEAPSWGNLSLSLSYKETFLTFVLMKHIVFTILDWKHEKHCLPRQFTIQASLEQFLDDCYFFFNFFLSAESELIFHSKYFNLLIAINKTQGFFFVKFMGYSF